MTFLQKERGKGYNWWEEGRWAESSCLTAKLRNKSSPPHFWLGCCCWRRDYGRLQQLLYFLFERRIRKRESFVFLFCFKMCTINGGRRAVYGEKTKKDPNKNYYAIVSSLPEFEQKTNISRNFYFILNFFVAETCILASNLKFVFLLEIYFFNFFLSFVFFFENTSKILPNPPFLNKKSLHQNRSK